MKPRRSLDAAIVALLVGCGLRRSELVALEARQLQLREDHWTIVDLIGKGARVRTVPVPTWVKSALDQWLTASAIASGRLFRPIRKNGEVWAHRVSPNVIYDAVKRCAARIGIGGLAPHDLRRSCARLCHAAGGELEQIQFLLGHSSVQTTECYSAAIIEGPLSELIRSHPPNKRNFKIDASEIAGLLLGTAAGPSLFWRDVRAASRRVRVRRSGCVRAQRSLR
jgi:integrase